MISYVNIVLIVLYILRLYVDLCRLILSMTLLVRNFVSSSARALCVSACASSFVLPVLLLVVSPSTFTEKLVGDDINLVFFCDQYNHNLCETIEDMQQIYNGTPMPKCDFNKVALQHLFLRTHLGGSSIDDLGLH